VNTSEGDITTPVSRLEVINTGRRRRFTEDEKLRIVAESFAGKSRASATARQYGISRSLLNRWLHQPLGCKADHLDLRAKTALPGFVFSVVKIAWPIFDLGIEALTLFNVTQFDVRQPR
jgi:hypothetical protein